MQCVQPQHANPLEPWPHVNTFKLPRADRNKSVYSTCHPSFGKTCVFALSSVQRLNKHSLAYATYYCFPVFVSTNHAQIWPRLWEGCREVWVLLLMMWCRRVALVTKHNSTPHLLSHEVTFGAVCQWDIPIVQLVLVIIIIWQVVFHLHWRWAVKRIWEAGYFHQECCVSCVKRLKVSKSNSGVSCACLTCITITLWFIISRFLSTGVKIEMVILQRT